MTIANDFYKERGLTSPTYLKLYVFSVIRNMVVALRLIHECHMIDQNWDNDFWLVFAFRYSQYDQHRP